MKKVYKVDFVEAHLNKSHPPQLGIQFTGTVTSGGWTRPELIAWSYFVPPADGIYDFDFVASPPRGIAIQALLPITGSITIENPPGELKGVRIHSATNSVVALIGDSKGTFDWTNAQPLYDGDPPWIVG